MQKLSQPQGDAVLDVVLQCRVVSTAYEQKAAHGCSGKTCKGDDKVAAQISADFQATLTTLGDLATYAEDELGVDDDIIQGIFLKHLPVTMTKKVA